MSNTDSYSPAPVEPPPLAAGLGPTPGRAHRPMKPATWGWLLALVGWSVLVSFYQLDGGSGLEPVEAWVAQPAREMYQNIARMIAERDEAGWQWRPLIIPEFCGETRLQKSPGAYWAVCLTSYLRGTPVDEVSARIPTAAAAVLLVVTIFWLTRRIAGDRAAVFAGFATASSAMFLHWSHGAASDLGVTALITFSLACLWIGSEDEPPGWKRNLLWLAGYFSAGLGMLYKLPLPLVCIGLPAFLYVLLRNRWRILASWWHLLGLALFLLPWLPWVAATMQIEETALFKWRVEYFDRVTGDLPNVASQTQWYFYLLYAGAALLLAIPYTLSLPTALLRPFRRQEAVNRNGVWFVLIWFVSLLVFLTIATGKETRYVLPAMPPLFVLLGGELAAFFDPARRVSPRWERLGLIAVCVLVPAGMCGLTFALYYFWRENASQDMFTWAEVWQPYAVAAVIFSLGAILAAVLHYQRRTNASFGALVGTMWAMWLWVWPRLMPILMSQMPFKDFAQQLETLTPEQQSAVRQIAQQDPRYIWYSDVRFPRVIDQLDLLQEQDGRRSLDYEIPRLVEEAVRLLEGDQLALFVASPSHYLHFLTELRAEWERAGRTLPSTYLWMQSRVGRADRRYVLFGNQPPPWDPPEFYLDAQLRARLGRSTEKMSSPPATLPSAESADASDE